MQMNGRRFIGALPPRLAFVDYCSSVGDNGANESIIGVRPVTMNNNHNAVVTSAQVASTS